MTFEYYSIFTKLYRIGYIGNQTCMQTDWGSPHLRIRLLTFLTEIYAKDRLKRDSVKEPLTPAEYRRLQQYVIYVF